MGYGKVSPSPKLGKSEEVAEGSTPSSKRLRAGYRCGDSSGWRQLKLEGSPTSPLPL